MRTPALTSSRARPRATLRLPVPPVDHVDRERNEHPSSDPPAPHPTSARTDSVAPRVLAMRSTRSSERPR